MTEPFVGQIQPFGFNFNPRGWAFCNGATLPIQQNTALFALLGTQYGGNGQTTFQLPNLAGRAGCQQGNGNGLTPRTIGETFGVNTVTLTQQEMPSHTHGINAYVQNDTSRRGGAPVTNGGLSLPGATTSRPFVAVAPTTTFAPTMLQPNAGGGLPHANQQPYLGLNFSIALQGIFPSFS
ncbi:tail fiber protein [Pseudoxanthomonas sp. Root630]|uniref:phage tail protein n=1 Tax=Pseudoxanthomonas sp. Root630 TaxID=1736574 RepID=UPI0007028295|nr:tail fiber protein [Pseudoxanthomonas sp. Root630]KRA45205.1 microcystin-dependent protein [Pseudoxanthomonas sp. Root630]